jgi:hypothetical protein
MSLPDSIDADFFTPVMADPESADSLELWLHGLLEDPLRDKPQAEPLEDMSLELPY